MSRAATRHQDQPTLDQPSSTSEESALALFGYLPSAQNLIYGSSNCNTTSSKRTAQSDSLPACLLPNNRLRSLNRPPGWTTRTDGGTVGGTVGRPTDRPTDRQQFSFSSSARPNERTNELPHPRSLRRPVRPSASVLSQRPPARLSGPSKGITHYKLTANELS